jgi:outer membrane receptor protein involved in Fe transport
VELSRGGFHTRLIINYVDDYHNPFGAVPGDVESWTTVDWAASYQLLGDLRVRLSAQNVLDEDPPFVSRSAVSNVALNFPIGFDPANANALGRLVVLEVSKRW